MNKLPHQPQRQNRKRKRHDPLTPSRTNQHGKDRRHHDGLGYRAANARPSTQDGEGGEGGAGDVEEEGGCGVGASEGGEEKLLLFGKGEM